MFGMIFSMYGKNCAAQRKSPPVLTLSLCLSWVISPSENWLVERERMRELFRGGKEEIYSHIFSSRENFS